MRLGKEIKRRSNSSSLLPSILLIAFSLTVHSRAAGQDGSSVDDVLRLKPVAYWPADEGKGSSIHDRSGHNNHGVLRSVPWRDGYLVFDNDFYQWIEVPHKKAFGVGDHNGD